MSKIYTCLSINSELCICKHIFHHRLVLLKHNVDSYSTVIQGEIAFDLPTLKFEFPPFTYWTGMSLLQWTVNSSSMTSLTGMWPFHRATLILTSFNELFVLLGFSWYGTVSLPKINLLQICIGFDAFFLRRCIIIPIFLESSLTF